MRYKNFHFFILSIFQILFVNAQVFDNFSDGDFTEHPSWIGDTALFAVSSNHELQLSAMEAGIAYLTLPHQYQDSVVEWRFSIALDFSPSNNNYAKVFLTTDRYDVNNENLSGYYLQFGENGSNDAVELCYRHHGEVTKIARGDEGKIATPFRHHYKIVRKLNEQWEIYCDRQGVGEYVLECEATHFSMHENIALAVLCQYTASNVRKFGFDNFYFGPPLIDTVKPSIISIMPMQDLRTLVVTFDENVTEASGLDCWNYCVNEELYPVFCQFLENNTIVSLFFANDFNEDERYRLVISSVTDFNNNKMDEYAADLSFYKIKPHDILIHEIMAQPSATMPLPPYEYIELKNRTNRELYIRNWTIQLGNNMRALPDITLKENGYAIIVAKNSLPFFENRNNVIAISSMNITNSGQRISLFNEEGTVIHTVNFSSQWHTQTIKREGGWSLEMMDVLNPCEGEENWDSSTSSNGGTPGKDNSITQVNRDNTLPVMSNITLEDSLTIILYFSETIVTPDSLIGKSISIKPDLTISSVTKISPENRAIRISVMQPPQHHLIYYVEIAGIVQDCSGLSVPQKSVMPFGVPEQAEKSEIIINELLVNPIESTRSIYVEIYNRSDKIVDLKDILIGSGGGEYPEQTVIAVEEGYQLLPQSYLVLCKNKKMTLQEYVVPYPERLVENRSLPTYAKKAGHLHITNHSLEAIDDLYYDEKMHYAMLSSTAGVALERINMDAETQNDHNWTSAAATYGYGTPGYQNSQYQEQKESNDVILLFPEIISPDNDGFNDYATIQCTFDKESYRITITIINRYGKIVKNLANNILCGKENLFTWDGATNWGEIASPDIYVIKFEYWNQDGERKKVQKSIGVK